MEKLDKASLEEIERQLSCPTGENGIEMGKELDKTNSGMTMNTIAWLDLSGQSYVLEIGHGNCGHLQKILAQADGIQYAGLEVSDVMFQEAKSINAELMQTHSVDFQMYDGENIPFADHSFSHFMTVNTLYFWKTPGKMLREIYRVLQPEGTAIITYAQKEFMESLPFIGDKFQLYSDADMVALGKSVGIELIQFEDRSEQVKSKTGEWITRYYSLAKFVKR